ncbi:hypothetical protein STRIP9103_03801 [Streptomyces ipomoeae 91-03]|uniref:Uncharacterized protein n=1 Tax=Streptomyces ipomoeae 91-03 TaxID=698759 RepID=L1KYA8_9ACTN|nr:hypothetical protein STRIP9103_03801 [Streptomyces ipomoeae 91-03]
MCFPLETARCRAASHPRPLSVRSGLCAGTAICMVGNEG